VQESVILTAMRSDQFTDRERC